VRLAPSGEPEIPVAIEWAPAMLIAKHRFAAALAARPKIEVVMPDVVLGDPVAYEPAHQ